MVITAGIDADTFAAMLAQLGGFYSGPPWLGGAAGRDFTVSLRRYGPQRFLAGWLGSPVLPMQAETTQAMWRYFGAEGQGERLAAEIRLEPRGASDVGAG